MKETRRTFREKCQSGCERNKEKREYREALQLRAVIEEEQTQTQERIENIIKKGKINPNVIREIKKTTQHNPDLEYDIKNENGETLMDPMAAKEYCATYFEELYQARPGTAEYAHWTEHIAEKILALMLDHKKAPPQEKPITMEEP